jgi:hypothetical protein
VVHGMINMSQRPIRVRTVNAGNLQQICVRWHDIYGWNEAASLCNVD